jgi:DNA-directed RNA polymerase specialized sigma subunit
MSITDTYASSITRRFNTERMTYREIREYRSRPGKFTLRFNELADELRAAGYRVHDAEVHRATQIENLDADEKQGIVDAFLEDRKLMNIAEQFGVSAVTVGRVVRAAFILEKAERAAAEAALAAQ